MASAQEALGFLSAAVGGADSMHLREALVKGVSNTALRGANGFARMLGQGDQLMRIPPASELSPLQAHVSVPTTVFFEATKASAFESAIPASQTIDSSIAWEPAPFSLGFPAPNQYPAFWFVVLFVLVLTLSYLTCYGLVAGDSTPVPPTQTSSGTQTDGGSLEDVKAELADVKAKLLEAQGNLARRNKHSGQLTVIGFFALYVTRYLKLRVKKLDQQLSAQASASQTDKERLAGEAAKAKTQLEKVSRDLSQQESKYTKTLDDFKRSKKLGKRQAQSLRDARKIVSRKNDKIEEMQASLGELHKAHTSLVDERDELGQSKSRAEDKIASLTEELGELQKVHTSLVGKRDELEQGKSKAEEEIASLKEELGELEKNKSAANRKVASLTDNNAMLERKASRLQREVRDLSAAKQTLELDITRSHARIFCFESTCEYLKKQVSLHQAKSLKPQFTLEAKVEQLSQLRSAAQAQIAGLIAERDGFKSEVAKQKGLYYLAKSDGEQMYNECTAARAEKEGLVAIIKLIKQYSDNVGDAGHSLLASGGVSQSEDWHDTVTSSATALRSGIERELAQQHPDIQNTLQCLAQQALDAHRYGVLHACNNRSLISTQEALAPMPIAQSDHRDSSILELSKQNRNLQDSLTNLQRLQQQTARKHQTTEERLTACRGENAHLSDELRKLKSNNQRLEIEKTKLEASEKSLKYTNLTLREQISVLMEELREYDPTASATRPSVTGERGRRRRAMSFPQAKPEVVSVAWLFHIFDIINEAVSAHRAHAKTLQEQHQLTGYYNADQWKSDKVQTASKQATNDFIDTLDSKLTGTEPELCELIKNLAHDLMERVSLETMHKVKNQGGKTGLKYTNRILVEAFKQLYEAHCRGAQAVTDYLRSGDWQKVVSDQQALKGDKLADALNWSLKIGADAAGGEAMITANAQETPAENEMTPAQNETTPAQNETTPIVHQGTPAVHQQTPPEHDKKILEHDEMPGEQQTPTEHEEKHAEHETPADGEQLPSQRNELAAEHEKKPAEIEENPVEHGTPAKQEEPSPAHKVPMGDKKGKKAAVGMTGSVWAGGAPEPPANAPKQPKSWNKQQNGPRNGQWNSHWNSHGNGQGNGHWNRWRK